VDVDVAVVGGGLSGLFTAAELRHRGVDDLVVLEAGDRPGGVARTLHDEEYILEPAAGTLLLPHPHLGPLLERGGVGTIPATASAAIRYVHTRGRLVGVSRSPKVAVAPLVPWGAKLRAAAEPFIRSRPRSDDESLADLLERRFGRRLGGLVAWLAASGVFAGDPRRLSARSAFPTLPALEAEAGSIVRGGLRRMRHRDRGTPRPSSHLPDPDMAGLADGLASDLGDRLRLGFVAHDVAAGGGGVVIEGTATVRARQVVLACRPEAAGNLLGGEVEDVLGRAVAAPVAVAWLGGSLDEVPLPDGFGALIAPDAGMHVVGILFESSYAPGRAPDGMALAKVIVGGAAHPEVTEWEEERILETVVAEASTALGRDLAPRFTRVVRHPRGIPQYEVGHQAWLDGVDAALPPGVHVTGWGYRGAGVAHLASDAARVAGVVAAR
jgi:protoporphyrinogen/coproporphyrinogen III oxidase